MLRTDGSAEKCTRPIVQAWCVQVNINATRYKIIVHKGQTPLLRFGLHVARKAGGEVSGVVFYKLAEGARFAAADPADDVGHQLPLALAVGGGWLNSALSPATGA
jgi:hypothetical protein